MNFEHASTSLEKEASSMNLGRLIYPTDLQTQSKPQQITQYLPVKIPDVIKGHEDQIVNVSKPADNFKTKRTEATKVPEVIQQQQLLITRKQSANTYINQHFQKARSLKRLKVSKIQPMSLVSYRAKQPIFVQPICGDRALYLQSMVNGRNYKTSNNRLTQTMTSNESIVQDENLATLSQKSSSYIGYHSSTLPRGQKSILKLRNEKEREIVLNNQKRNAFATLEYLTVSQKPLSANSRNRKPVSFSSLQNKETVKAMTNQITPLVQAENLESETNDITFISKKNSYSPDPTPQGLTVSAFNQNSFTNQLTAVRELEKSRQKQQINTRNQKRFYSQTVLTNKENCNRQNRLSSAKQFNQQEKKKLVLSVVELGGISSTPAPEVIQIKNKDLVDVQATQTDDLTIQPQNSLVRYEQMYLSKIGIEAEKIQSVNKSLTPNFIGRDFKREYRVSSIFSTRDREPTPRYNLRKSQVAEECQSIKLGEDLKDLKFISDDLIKTARSRKQKSYTIPDPKSLNDMIKKKQNEQVEKNRSVGLVPFKIIKTCQLNKKKQHEKVKNNNFTMTAAEKQQHEQQKFLEFWKQSLGTNAHQEQAKPELQRLKSKEQSDELLPNFQDTKIGKEFSFQNLDRYQSCQLKQQAMALLVPGHIQYLFN